MLFSRQILNGFQDFFFFNPSIFIYFFKYETIETHARTFLTLNILAIGRVSGDAYDWGGWLILGEWVAEGIASNPHDFNGDQTQEI